MRHCVYVYLWRIGGQVILIVPRAARASAERGGVLWGFLVLRERLAYLGLRQCRPVRP
jgi:hypothetical protein